MMFFFSKPGVMGERCQVVRDDCANFPTKNEERFRTLSNPHNHGRFNPTAPWQHPQVKAFPDVVTPGMPWWSGAVGDS